MVRCPNCGKDNLDNQRLCFWCGANLAGVETTVSGGGMPKVPAQKHEPALPAEKVEIPKPESPAPPAEKKPQQEPVWPEERGSRKPKLIAGVIVIIAVVVAVGYYFLLLGGVGPGGIVVPAGFKQTAQATENNYAITTYTGTTTAQDAASAFTTSMQNAGWTYKGEGSAAGYTGASFVKGNEIAVVAATEEAGQATVVVVIGPKPTEGEEGEGPSDVPPYPGASPYPMSEEIVSAIPEGISISFYTISDNLDNVMSWYRENMAGWEKIKDNTGIIMSAPVTALLYKSADNGALILAQQVDTMLVIGIYTGDWQTVSSLYSENYEPYVDSGAPSYPAITAVATTSDNAIRIIVSSGSISAGDWSYSISTVAGSYSWTTGNETLDAPYVSLGERTADNYYVSLKHVPSGHIYFTDAHVEVTYG